MICKRRTSLLALAALALMWSADCRDTATSPALMNRAAGRNAEISDGTHGAIADRNDDVFFLPPMVSSPVGAPGYGDPFQPGLPVTIRVCIVTATDCTLFTSFGPDQVKASTDHYGVNWDTKSPDTDPTITYRIEVYVGSTPEFHPNAPRPTPLAFADVDVVSSGSQLKNVNTGAYIPLLDGRTLPINVRIEKGWTCKNNASCVSQVVPNDLGTASVTVVSNDGLNAAQFTGHWYDGNFPVVVSIEDISNQVNQPGGTGCSLGLPNVVLTSNHCVRFTTNPRVVFTNTVTVNTCMQLPLDDRQLLLKYDVDETPTFLRDAIPPVKCPVGFASTNKYSNPVARFAANAWSKLAGLLGPKEAYAIDLGVGSSVDAGGGFSVFALGLPGFMSPVAGDNQTGVVGSVLPIQPKVSITAAHAHGDESRAISGASVTCTASSSPAGTSLLVVGDGTQASATAVDNNDGTYTCPSWQLGAGQADYTLTVTAPNLAANQQLVVNGEEGTETETLSGSVTFTAHAVAQLFGSIAGTVTDASGAVIPGATVTAVLGDGSPHTALTNAKGSYQIVQLTPGTYAVSVSASGFTELTQDGVIVTAGATTPVSFSPPSTIVIR